MNDVRVFTTPILDGIRIREYKGLVVARNVRAVNIFRDFFTGVRDVVGGRSGSYQKVMDSMQDEVLDEVKEDARRLGANAIVALQLDYDNIGSKDKSLLMVSAKGTAVVIEYNWLNLRPAAWRPSLRAHGLPQECTAVRPQALSPVGENLMYSLTDTPCACVFRVL